MEVLAVVAGLVGPLVSCAKYVRDFGSAFYDARDEWNQFPAKVDQLIRTSKDWDRNVVDLGLEWCKHRLIPPLRRAQDLLEQEERELKRRQQDDNEGKKEATAKGKRQMKTRRIFKQVMFPSEIGRSVNEVIKAFEDLHKCLKDRQEARAIAEIEALNRFASLDFTEDTRYVRLRQTEQAVRKALARCDASSLKLVLLYGQLGRGKSTLARDIALQINSSKNRNAELLPIVGDPSRSSASDRFTSAAASMELSETFQGVVFLNCGPEGESLKVKMELRQKLGWTTAERSRDDKDLLKWEVEKSLEGLLQNKKLLIVLDDVWDCSLIVDMLLPTRNVPNVKFLVTSQRHDLCDGLNPQYRWEGIEVEKVNLADARKVLIHHIPRIDISADNSFSKEIQECADRIIEMVEANLLAVACVGGAFFNDTDVQNLNKWKEVEADLENWLNQTSDAVIQDKYYSRGSYYAALKFSISRLTPDEKRLLILLILGEISGYAQDEDVVRYWYGTTNDTRICCQPYCHARRTLEKRQFVRKTLGRDSVLAPLQQFFTNRLGGEHKDSTLLALSDISRTQISTKHMDFVSILGNFYSEDSDFFERIAKKLKFSNPVITDNVTVINEADRIQEIEP